MRSPLQARNLLLVLLVLSLGVFLVRGPFRVSERSIDLAAPYVASVRMMHGVDPYLVPGFIHDWEATGASSTANIDQSGQRPVYPPPTLLVLAPLTLLRWALALHLLVWSCAGLYLLLLYRLALEIPSNGKSLRRPIFMVAGLLFAPIHTGLFTGNLSILAFLLCSFAALFAFHRRTVVAGLLLALGCCVKPTAGFTILLFFLICQQWRVVFTCVASGAAVLLASAWRIEHIAPAWRLHYKQNLAYLFGPLGVASFLPINDCRYQILSLQVPLLSLLHSEVLSTVVAWCLTLALLAAWGALHLQRMRQGTRLWTWNSFSILAILSLLPIYQRFYNAGLVLFALLVALQAWRSREAKWIATLAIWVALPMEEGLRLQVQPHLPAVFARSLVWRFGIMASDTWAILIVLVLLLQLMRTENREMAEERGRGTEVEVVPVGSLELKPVDTPSA